MLDEAPHLACLHLARPLFASDIAIAAANPRVSHDIWPEEAASLPKSVTKRSHEFSAGRDAARRAMAAFGHRPEPVPHRPDRAPIWPKGITGSISHSATACLAVVGDVRALGVDIEEAAPLDPTLFPMICTPTEREWLADQPKIMSKLIFSAKECAYKAQYTLSRTLFDFQTLELQIGDGEFSARFLRDVAPFCAGACLTGVFALDDAHIVTAMTVRA